VIRYSFFTLSLSGLLPGFLSWLRYNSFWVLYPLGISSECWLIYKAVEPAKKIRQEYAWLLQLILAVYVPGEFWLWRVLLKELLMGTGSYILFTHMMAQRKKVMREKQVKRTE
jgi:very-long-chain (3R)-3-hydroxyacyl-CoA dehydratase